MVPGSSRFPSRCWIQRVQEPGSGPDGPSRPVCVFGDLHPGPGTLLLPNHPPDEPAGQRVVAPIRSLALVRTPHCVVKVRIVLLSMHGARRAAGRQVDQHRAARPEVADRDSEGSAGHVWPRARRFSAADGRRGARHRAGRSRGVRRCDEQGAGLAVWRGGPLVSAPPRKSRPWHLWLIVVVATFFMSVGLYDFVMVATRNQAYLTDRYTSAGVEYFSDYPWYLLVLFGINVIGVMLALIVSLWNRRAAMWLALVSGAADVVLLLVTIFFRD